MSPLDDSVLAEESDIAFMCYCLDEYGGEADVTDEEMLEGRHDLTIMIQTCQPKIVCFVGRKTFEHFHERKRLRTYGLQRKRIQSTDNEHLVFVIPGTVESVQFQKDRMKK